MVGAFGLDLLRQGLCDLALALRVDGGRLR
jgi:hypothetical protein